MQYRLIGRSIIPHEAIAFIAKWIHWTQKYFTGCNMSSCDIGWIQMQYYFTESNIIGLNIDPMGQNIFQFLNYD